MGKGYDILQTIARLLTVKHAQGLSAAPPPHSDDLPIEDSVTCVNCGYSQQGQSLDRCPECGLAFASRLRDSTPWLASSSRAVGWWKTASLVWHWDRRLRFRTGYLPVTPESWSFARWSIAGSALFLGLAVALFHYSAQTPRPFGFSFFVVQAAVAAVFAGLILLAGTHGLTLHVRGTWRRRLRFVPSSVHYATAWWPLLSFVALFAGTADVLLDLGLSDALCIIVPLLIVVTWGLWLWDSVSVSEHVPNAATRIGVVALGMCAVALTLMSVAPGSGRTMAASLFDRAGASLLKLNVLGTYTATPVTDAPRTCALFIDMIPSGDEDLINRQVSKLGASDCVWIVNASCTLEQIEKAMRTARGELRSQDRFILYINGHGDPEGSGSIVVAKGELTRQKLTELLQGLPTEHCLVVLDSCFSGKFIRGFRDGSCNAVVITASDDQNVAFRSGLQDFWNALDDRAADQDLNGRIDVDEAFWYAYRKMLVRAEKTRQQAMAEADKRNLPQLSQILTEHGFATPQLEAVGSALKCDFGVPTPPPKPFRAQPSSPTPPTSPDSPEPPPSRSATDPHSVAPTPPPQPGTGQTDNRARDPFKLSPLRLPASP